MPVMKRDYSRCADRISPHTDRDIAMRGFVDVLWEALREQGVSWIGFYLKDGDTQMTLGPSRNKPACSPIGLHGACGQTLLSGQPMVVRDVAELGAGYIACDPRDRSEVVIPLFNESGECYGVLDADSYEVGAFTQDDVRDLHSLLIKAELTHR